MTLKLSFAALSDRGRQRELNEDSFYYKVVQASDEDPLGLFVLADGMGGQLAGEVASHWAVQTLKRKLGPLFEPRDPAATRKFQIRELQEDTAGEASPTRPSETDLADFIRQAVQRANDVLLGYAGQKPDEAEGMGSTVTLAVIQDGQAVVANVGDSRTYLWRDGHLRQLTHDHSVPGALLAAGKIKPGDVYTHEQRHLLYRCLGHKPVVEPDVFQPLALRPGDALLLCSDGLWEELRTSGIAEVMASEPDVTLAAARMVDAANEAGGEDNITVVVVRVRE